MEIYLDYIRGVSLGVEMAEDPETEGNVLIIDLLFVRVFFHF